MVSCKRIKLVKQRRLVAYSQKWQYWGRMFSLFLYQKMAAWYRYECAFCAQVDVHSSANVYDLERHITLLQNAQVMRPCSFCSSFKSHHRVKYQLLLYLRHHKAQMILVYRHVCCGASNQSAKIRSDECACLPSQQLQIYMAITKSFCRDISCLY